MTVIPLKNILINYKTLDSTNYVELVIDYGQNNIEGSYLQFNILPSNTNLLALQNLSHQTNLTVRINSEQTGVYLFDYGQDVYEFQNLLSTLGKVVGIVTLVMAVLGLFMCSGKVILLEAFAVVQIAFFSLLQYQKVPPSFIGFKICPLTQRSR